MGAFAKAQQEGGKVFEALVKEGAGLQRKTQAAAGQRMSQAADKVTAAAEDLGNKAGQQWDRLESIFEERVAKALQKLGVPTTAEVQALSDRVDALSAQVARLAKTARTTPKAPKRRASAGSAGSAGSPGAADGAATRRRAATRKTGP
jgi:poly(hydroxyalkanoate) granule-associated protein